MRVPLRHREALIQIVRDPQEVEIRLRVVPASHIECKERLEGFQNVLPRRTTGKLRILPVSLTPPIK